MTKLCFKKMKREDNFYNIEYNGRKVMDQLIEIYQKDISIEERIEEGYEIIKNSAG